MIIHSKGKRETIIWFLLAFVPIVNLYFIWRLAKLIAQHEDTESESSKEIKAETEKKKGK